MPSQICSLADCATKALNKNFCAVVSAAALDHYAKIAETIKKCLCIDINELFSVIALLAVLCWISQFITEIIHFVTRTIPNFISNLCHGKFSLCLLDCSSDKSEHDDDDSTEY